MQFELTRLTVINETTVSARLISVPIAALEEGVNATFEVPVAFSMDDSFAIISDRAMEALKATLAA